MEWRDKARDGHRPLMDILCDDSQISMVIVCRPTDRGRGHKAARGRQVATEKLQSEMIHNVQMNTKEYCS
jgi:hypothetical protein